VTQWVEAATGGRDRGPFALARAWCEILVRPRRCFDNAIAPADQAPGLVFLVAVVLVEETTRAAVVAGAERGLVDTGPFAYPELTGLSPLVTVVFVLLVAVLLAPAILHLVAALQTLVLVALAPDRGGVGETVQVIAYATAPCVVAGVPDPRVRLACGLWGGGLYVLGISRVHGLSPARALVAAAVPAVLIFGYGFRAVPAARLILGT
jgi:hypothetical protein